MPIEIDRGRSEATALHELVGIRSQLILDGLLCVNKAEIERTLNKPPETWQAYDYYLRAADAHASFLSSWEAAELYEVPRLLEHSLAICPNYARAYATLARTHISAWLVSLDGDHLDPACTSLRRANAHHVLERMQRMRQAREEA